MNVIGIDPGTHRLGWAIVTQSGRRFIHVAHGVIAPKEALLGDRLVTIERELARIVREYQPDTASIETIFFHKDAQAAAKLGHARGVALLVCAREGLAVAEYAPARVKRAVTGHGRAEKKQVANMMRVILGLQSVPPADAADALAIAVTHLQVNIPLQRLLKPARTQNIFRRKGPSNGARE